MELKQTKTRKATWLGQPGEGYELRVAGASGPRITVHRWLADGKQGDEGTGFVRVLSGNFSKGTGKLHHKLFVPKGGFDKAIECAEAKLAEVTR